MTEKFHPTDSLLAEGQEYDTSYLEEVRQFVYDYIDEDIESDSEESLNIYYSDITFKGE